MIFLATPSPDILVWPRRSLAQTYSEVMILMKSALQWWEDNGGGVRVCVCKRGVGRGEGDVIFTQHLFDSRGEPHSIDPYKRAISLLHRGSGAIKLRCAKFARTLSLYLPVRLFVCLFLSNGDYSNLLERVLSCRMLQAAFTIKMCLMMSTTLPFLVTIMTHGGEFLLLCSPIVCQIEHLYGLTVFENYLYATNSDEGNLNPKTSVIRVNRFNSSDFQVVTRVDRGAALHVYHQRRQPQGTRLRKAQIGSAANSSTLCLHLCVLCPLSFLSAQYAATRVPWISSGRQEVVLISVC